MYRILVWMKDETLSVLPAIIYFCVIFNIIYFVSGLSLAPGTERYFSYLTVNVGALIVGKVMILANLLPFINAFPHRPLIYNILWKFLIYNSLVVLAWAAESFVHLALRFDSLSLALTHLKNELLSPIFLSNLILLMLFFMIFILFAEFIHAIGVKKARQMMFG